MTGSTTPLPRTEGDLAFRPSPNLGQNNCDQNNCPFVHVPLAGRRALTAPTTTAVVPRKNIFYSFFPPTQRGNPRARRARSTRRGMRVERVPQTGSGSLARSFIRSFVRSCVRALTMRREYEHVLIPSEDGSARAGPATLLNDGETDATRTADRARIFRH